MIKSRSCPATFLLLAPGTVPKSWSELSFSTSLINHKSISPSTCQIPSSSFPPPQITCPAPLLLHKFILCDTLARENPANLKNSCHGFHGGESSISGIYAKYAIILPITSVRSFSVPSFLPVRLKNAFPSVIPFPSNLVILRTIRANQPPPDSANLVGGWFAGGMCFVRSLPIHNRVSAPPPGTAAWGFERSSTPGKKDHRQLVGFKCAWWVFFREFSTAAGGLPVWLKRTPRCWPVGYQGGMWNQAMGGMWNQARGGMCFTRSVACPAPVRSGSICLSFRGGGGRGRSGACVSAGVSPGVPSFCVPRWFLLFLGAAAGWPVPPPVPPPSCPPRSDSVGGGQASAPSGIGAPKVYDIAAGALPAAAPPTAPCPRPPRAADGLVSWPARRPWTMTRPLLPPLHSSLHVAPAQFPLARPPPPATFRYFFCSRFQPVLP